MSSVHRRFVRPRPASRVALATCLFRLRLKSPPRQPVISYNTISGEAYFAPVQPFSAIAPYNGLPTYHGCSEDLNTEGSLGAGQGSTFCLFETQPDLTIGGIVTYIGNAAHLICRAGTVSHSGACMHGGTGPDGPPGAGALPGGRAAQVTALS